MLINDKTDPSLLLPRAVDCPADESKGGAVAELARNVSNPGKGGRLVAWVVATPLAPKYGAAAASAGAAEGNEMDHSLSLDLKMKTMWLIILT